jgi:SAM-dependent methyltransferase
MLSPDAYTLGTARAPALRYDWSSDDPAEVAGILHTLMPSSARVLDIGCGTGAVTIVANRSKGIYLRETARTLNRLCQPGEIQAGDRAAANVIPFTRPRHQGNPPNPLRGLIRAARRRGASVVEALADVLRPN